MHQSFLDPAALLSLALPRNRCSRYGPPVQFLEACRHLLNPAQEKWRVALLPQPHRCAQNSEAPGRGDKPPCKNADNLSTTDRPIRGPLSNVLFGPGPAPNRTAPLRSEGLPAELFEIFQSQEQSAPGRFPAGLHHRKPVDQLEAGWLEAAATPRSRGAGLHSDGRRKKDQIAGWNLPG